MFFCINYSLQSSDFYSRSLLLKLTLMEGDYDFIDVCSFIIYLPFVVSQYFCMHVLYLHNVVVKGLL